MIPEIDIEGSWLNLTCKQTLKHYEKTVYSIAQAVQNVLNSDQDMADLYLTENTWVY